MSVAAVRASITPIILSGGAGTRLWPLSRRHNPKQLIPLLGEETMLQLTARRVAGEGFAPLWVVCGDSHHAVVRDQLGAAGVPAATVVIEPMARNTAPAVAAAAFALVRQGDDAYTLVLPSDHLVADVAAFLAAVDRAAAAAQQGKLVAFGLPPAAPETGYGYVARGDALDGLGGAFSVARFKEKPDRDEAETLVADGGYYWNSGMFLFRADAYLAELKRHAPTVHAACEEAVRRATHERGVVRLDADAFAGATSISIDHAVVEHTSQAAVVPAEMGWSDVGAFSALWDVGTRDASGNVVRGDVVSEATHDSYLHSNGPLLATVGVRDMVVVANDDAVLVARKDAVQGVRDIAARLAAEGRPQMARHRRETHSWGCIETIADEPDFRVRRIDINAGRSVTFPPHGDSPRKWIGARGTVRVEAEGERFEIAQGGTAHLAGDTGYVAAPVGDGDAAVLEISYSAPPASEKE